jgi:uncharacterized protein GlcG (DUF336 family)
MRKLSIVLMLVAFAAAPALAQQTPQERAQEQRERARQRADEQRRRDQERAEQQRQRDQERREQRRSSGSEQTDRQTRTFNIGADGELDVSNIAGDIVITRAGGNSATIDILKTARGEDAQNVLQLVTVDIVERGNRVEVRTRYPDSDELRRRNRRNINVDVMYTITAPQNTRIVARSISGSLSARDISGPLTLESVSGGVTVANAGRMVSAKSISGDVEASDTQVAGTLEAGSISGAVRFRRTTARSATLSSVSGDVVIEDVTCDRVEAQSVSGQVMFSGDLSPNGHYELGSHSGNVQVTISQKSGFQLEATTFSGSIDTQLPLTLRGQGPGPGRRGTVRATFGNGSAMLELNAFSGNITINKR